MPDPRKNGQTGCEADKGTAKESELPEEMRRLMPKKEGRCCGRGGSGKELLP